MVLESPGARSKRGPSVTIVPEWQDALDGDDPTARAVVESILTNLDENTRRIVEDRHAEKLDPTFIPRAVAVIAGVSEHGARTALAPLWGMRLSW